MKKTIKITKRQYQVLRALERARAKSDTWHTPKSLGGTDGSWHGLALRRLADKGIVQQRQRRPMRNVGKPFGGLRHSYFYRAQLPRNAPSYVVA